MHVIIAILFLVFAMVQYNDPDAYIWIPAYSVISAVALSYFYGYKSQKIILALIIVYSIWMLTYSPELINWVYEGLPTITGSMKAESPFIEFVREFFGLLLCLFALTYYWRKSK